MQQSDVVLRLGRLMLAAGAGAYRVKSSMARAAAAVGLDRHEATVTMSEIVTSSYVGGRFRTEACEVRHVGVNVDRLEALRRIVHDLRAHESVEGLESKLDAVERRTALYGPAVNALASGVACAGFSFLNGGGWIEVVSVLIAASIGQLVRRHMLHRHIQHFFTWIVCGVSASGAYMLIVTALHAAGIATGSHQGGLVSSILFLVPGFPLVTAMLDLVRQDLSSAVSRAAYVLMVMAAGGVAVWTVTFAFQWQVEADAVALPTGLALHVLRCAASFVAAYGFAVLFNAGPKACLLAAVIGAVVNTARLVVIEELGVPWQLAVGLAALCIGLLAQAFVARVSLSRVALSVPAVVIMIPGVPFYRAIKALNDRTVDTSVAAGQAAANLAEVFFVVVAIGVGMAMARILTDRNWRHDVATSERLVLPEPEGPRPIIGD
ncbi:threonine/serine exporter family protein [Actinomyces howellii]|uniref:Inner membrane protein YjjP n=1 Tax=Actinomyces howellii TaxID=52771 RepID=A0A3S4RCL3_9ACTO|nr:threonine/serine exporter family protein [Actinomyces howellii]VEG30120.1 Inner membrane protein YjjP [Actinomyces howellii]